MFTKNEVAQSCPTLCVVYNLSNVLLNSVYWYFVEDFCICSSEILACSILGYPCLVLVWSWYNALFFSWLFFASFSLLLNPSSVFFSFQTLLFSFPEVWFGSFTFFIPLLNMLILSCVPEHTEYIYNSRFNVLINLSICFYRLTFLLVMWHIFLLLCMHGNF